MFRPTWKFLMVGVILIGTVAVGASSAEAGWWWAHPAHSSWSPCYTPSYSPCRTVGYGPFGGEWQLGFRPGPVRRFLFGPYRWYWSGWCSRCYSRDVCYCEEDAAGPAKKAPKKAKPAAKSQAPQSAPKPPAAGTPNKPTSALPAQANSSLLTISVPGDAKVTINGLATKSTGSRRQYVSHGLKPGFAYNYEIRARIVRDGKLVEEVRNIRLTAGARQNVAFGFNPELVEGIAQLQ